MKKDFLYSNQSVISRDTEPDSLEEQEEDEFELRHGSRENYQIPRKRKKSIQESSSVDPETIKTKLQQETTAYENSLSSSGKFKISTGNDTYEQEANMVASQIIQNFNSPLNISEPSGSNDIVNLPAFNPPVTSEVSENLESMIEDTSGKGNLLDGLILGKMEHHLNTDLNDVAIHTDDQSATMAEMIDAKAFTIGKDIYFNRGEYDPESEEGQWLLAHELTHVHQAKEENDTTTIRRSLSEGPTTEDGLTLFVSDATTVMGFAQDAKDFVNHLLTLDPNLKISSIIVFTQNGLDIYKFPDLKFIAHYDKREGELTLAPSLWFSNGGLSMIGLRNGKGVAESRTFELTDFSEERQQVIKSRGAEDGYYKIYPWEDMTTATEEELESKGVFPAIVITGFLPASENGVKGGDGMAEWANDQVKELNKKLGLDGKGNNSKGKGDKEGKEEDNDSASSDPLLKDPKAAARRPTSIVPWVREDGKQFINVWVGGRKDNSKKSKELEKGEIKVAESVELIEGESIEDLQKRVEAATEKARKKLTDKAIDEEGKIVGGNVAYNDSTYLGGDDKGGPTANRPAYRSSMTGPEIMTKNGTGAYKMRIHYEDEFPDLLGQVAAAYHGSEYAWQIIDISALYQQVMQERAAAIQSARDQLMRGQTPAEAAPGVAESALKDKSHSKLSDMKTVGRFDADIRDLHRRYDNFTEDAAQAAYDLSNPYSSQDGSDDKAMRSVLVNTFNLATLPLNGILSLGGWVVRTISGIFFKDPEYEREIPFPDDEGYYLVRCVAQPRVIGEGEKALIRMPSVSVKVVQVKEIQERTREELNVQDQNLQASILELLLSYRHTDDKEQLEKMKSVLEVQVQQAAQSNLSFLKNEIIKREIERDKPEQDEKVIAKIDEELAILRQGTTSGSGLISQVIAKQIVIKEKEYAKETHPYRKRDIGIQLAELRRRLGTASAREAEMQASGQPIVRPQAVFVNEENGQTIPLLIEIGQMGNHSPSRGYTMRVSDITGADNDTHDAIGRTKADAVKNAIKEYAGHFPYGRGYLMVRIPANSGYGINEEITFRCNPRDTAQANERLDQLLQVLAVIGLLIPGVGVAVAAVGAAVSAARIIKRLDNHTFAWDTNTMMDILNIFGTVSMGVSKLAGAKLAATNKLFAIIPETEDIDDWVKRLTRLSQFKKVIDIVDTSVNHVSYLLGSMEVVNQFLEIQQQLAKGDITHAEARRRRAQLMSQAMYDHVMQHGANLTWRHKGDGTIIKSDEHDSGLTPNTDTDQPIKTNKSTADSDNITTNKNEPAINAETSGTTKSQIKSPAADQKPADKTPVQRVKDFLADRNNIKSLLKGDKATLRKLLETHGNWRDLLMYLQSENQNDIYMYLIDELSVYRQDIVNELKTNFGLDLSDPKASTHASSDVDLASTGKDAGKKVSEAEKYMRDQYGENWSELLRMNFYTEAERLFMYEQVQHLMTDASYGNLQSRLTNLAELLNFAKMLQHAGDNASSVSRVEKLMEHLSDAQRDAIRNLAKEKPDQAKKQVEELHHSIDDLSERFELLQQHQVADIPASVLHGLSAKLPQHLKDAITNAKSPDALKIALAEAISELQMMANFRTQEAYISPGAARQAVRSAEVKGHEAYQSALANLEMMEHILHVTKGNVEVAIREYELYKYIFRFLSAVNLSGIRFDSFMMLYYQAAQDVYKNNRTMLQGVNQHDLAYINAMHKKFLEEAAALLPQMKAVAEKNPSASDNPVGSGEPIKPKKAPDTDNAGKTGSAETNSNPKVKGNPGDKKISDKPGVPVEEKQKKAEELDKLPSMSVMTPPDPSNYMDATLMFENSIKEDPKRESGLFYNETLDMYIIVQGDELQVAVENGDLPVSTEVQKWHELLADPSKISGLWKLVAHSHPQDASGQVSFANRFPSGANGDWGAIVRQSRDDGRTPQSSAIYYLTDRGMEVTFFRYNPYADKPLQIDYPHPVTSMRTIEHFTTLDAYHDWVRNNFNIELGSIPSDLTQIHFKDPNNPTPVPIPKDDATGPITVREGKNKVSATDDAKNKKPRPVGRKDDFDMYWYSWPDDPKAIVTFKVEKNEVILDHVKRGGQPKGSAGTMLTDAVREAGFKPSSIFVPNILQHQKNSDEVLETVVRNAVTALGGTVGEITKGVDGLGKHWVRITIKY